MLDVLRWNNKQPSSAIMLANSLWFFSNYMQSPLTWTKLINGLSNSTRKIICLFFEVWGWFACLMGCTWSIGWKCRGVAEQNSDLSNVVLCGYEKVKITWTTLIKCLSNSIREIVYHSCEFLSHSNALSAQVKLLLAIWHDNASKLTMIFSDYKQIQLTWMNLINWFSSRTRNI